MKKIRELIRGIFSVASSKTAKQIDLELIKEVKKKIPQDDHEQNRTAEKIQDDKSN